MTISIILADDHRIFREGLRSLLEQEIGLEVIAEAESGREAVRLTKKLLPDVALIDITMPDLNGIEATRRIVSNCPSTKVIALSMHSDERFVSEMLRAGASGYLPKGCTIKELLLAIKAVLAKGTYLSPAIAGVVAEGFIRQEGPAGPSAFSVLTGREREVLQVLAEGKSTKQTARDLGVSANTVYVHRKHIMDKLDVHSVAKLVKYAVREGLSSLEH